jgi:hypothetical protein
MKRHLITVTLITVVATLLGTAAGYTAGGQTSTPGGPTLPPQLPASAVNRAAMLDQMETLTRELDALVVKMNAASGQAKVDAIAATVTKLADAHKRLAVAVLTDPTMPKMMPEKR